MPPNPNQPPLDYQNPKVAQSDRAHSQKSTLQNLGAYIGAILIVIAIPIALFLAACLLAYIFNSPRLGQYGKH